MFRVAEKWLIGQPENLPPFILEYVFEVAGQTFVIPDEPLATEVAGKPMRRLAVISPVSLKFGSSVALFTPEAAKMVEVEITAARCRRDWHSKNRIAVWLDRFTRQPVVQNQRQGRRENAGLPVHSDRAGTGNSIRQFSRRGGNWRARKFSNLGAIEIRYDHIPVQLLQSAARLKVVAFDYAIRGKAVEAICPARATTRWKTSRSSATRSRRSPARI